MNSFVEVIEIRHVKVYAHWSVLAIGGLFLVGALERPLELLVALFSYYGVILLHECGHMVAAQRKGCRVNFLSSRIPSMIAQSSLGPGLLLNRWWRFRSLFGFPYLAIRGSMR